jgi:phosphoglycerate dehydrogenase-like enzyme
MPTVMICPEAQLHKPAPYVDILQEGGFDIIYPKDPTFTRGHFSDNDTIDVLKSCDAVVAGGEVFSESVLESLPKLRVIARSGVGYDKVNVPAATRLDKVLTITPNGNYDAVAEHAISLLFAITKNTIANDHTTRNGTWIRSLTRPLRGTTLGIVGLGRIGRSVATRAGAMGMSLVATELYPDMSFVETHNISLIPIEELLSQSDYVTVHCPANEDTYGMFNKHLFSLMKKGSMFINTARGSLVVENDLIEALNSGHIAGAGLDVFETEPVDSNNPLNQLNTVVLSPHVAGEDEQSTIDMGVEAATCIVNLYRGEWPDDAVVNKELKDNWSW